MVGAHRQSQDREKVNTLMRWLGRQARWALPAGVFVGILWPELAQATRPLLSAAVVGTLSAALLRMDWAHMVTWLQRPMWPVMLTLWVTLISPLCVWGLTQPMDLPPSWRMLIVLQAAGPPIGSAAAFAMFLGLEASLCMVSTVCATLILPLTLTAIVAGLMPLSGIEVDVGRFFLRVLMLVALPFSIAALLRRWIGVQRLQQCDAELAGLNVLMLVLFALAVMDGVQDLWRHDTALAGSLLALGCASVLFWHLMGLVVGRMGSVNTAYSSALLTGNRNMGLLLVVTAGTAGDLFAMYVAMVQIPMYFAPLLLGPWLKRARRTPT
jgi:BASS family bile acid:Na+ symporter